MLKSKYDFFDEMFQDFRQEVVAPETDDLHLQCVMMGCFLAGSASGIGHAMRALVANGILTEDDFERAHGACEPLLDEIEQLLKQLQEEDPGTPNEPLDVGPPPL